MGPSPLYFGAPCVAALLLRATPRSGRYVTPLMTISWADTAVARSLCSCANISYLHCRLSARSRAQERAARTC